MDDYLRAHPSIDDETSFAIGSDDEGFYIFTIWHGHTGSVPGCPSRFETEQDAKRWFNEHIAEQEIMEIQGHPTCGPGRRFLRHRHHRHLHPRNTEIRAAHPRSLGAATCPRRCDQDRQIGRRDSENTTQQHLGRR